MKGNDCPYRHQRGEKSVWFRNSAQLKCSQRFSPLCSARAVMFLFWQVVCKHWLRGLCKKGDNCEFLHEYDLSKMPPCHFFINYGRSVFSADSLSTSL
jgi:hypothetical protein